MIENIYLCIYIQKQIVTQDPTSKISLQNFEPRSITKPKLRLAQTKISFSRYHPVLQKLLWIFVRTHDRIKMTLKRPLCMEIIVILALKRSTLFRIRFLQNHRIQSS